MADPTPYAVSYSFANFQANAPATPLPGARVDVELANVSAAVASLVSSIKDVRRSDGAMKNGIVTLDSLGVGVLAGLANLNTGAAAALDAAVASIQSNVDADIAGLAASKANLVHTHTALQVSVSAISGIVGTTVQAVLAELRALGPQTGDFLLALTSAVRAGWVPCDDGSISAAGAAGSTRANADCWPLYNALYTEVSDAYAPVIGGRSGVDSVAALADFNSLKPIGLTKMLGRALAIAGAGSTLTSRLMGLATGEEAHALSSGENGPHDHGGSTGDLAPGLTINGTPAAGTANTSLGGGSSRFQMNNQAGTDVLAVVNHHHLIASSGSGTPHNNMQPTAFTLHAFLKL